MSRFWNFYSIPFIVWDSFWGFSSCTPFVIRNSFFWNKVIPRASWFIRYRLILFSFVSLFLLLNSRLRRWLGVPFVNCRLLFLNTIPFIFYRRINLIPLTCLLLNFLWRRSRSRWLSLNLIPFVGWLNYCWFSLIPFIDFRSSWWFDWIPFITLNSRFHLNVRTTPFVFLNWWIRLNVVPFIQLLLRSIIFTW